MTKKILIGSAGDLHTGIHAALINTPPPGFRYEIRNANHVFLFPETSRKVFSPHEIFHCGEFIDFGLGTEPVHGYQWPVLGRRSWIAELPDISHVTIGRYAYHPKARLLFRTAMSKTTFQLLQRRVGAAIQSYLHPSCKAVLCHARGHLRIFENNIRAFVSKDSARRFLRKCKVVYPASAALSKKTVAKKWDHPKRLNVLFCGRDYAVKNGAMALDLFAKLAIKYPNTRFTYVGDIPNTELKRHRKTLSFVKHHAELPHPQVMRIFEKSHILFHPSRFEGYGMVFVEAAACGMAVIAGSDDVGGMHTHELLGDRGALLVNRSKTPLREESSRFGMHLDLLLAKPALAKKLALHNHRQAVSGIFSLKRRDKILSQVYGRAFSHPAARPLTLESLAPTATEQAVVMTREKIRSDLIRCLKRTRGFKTVVQI